MVFIIFFLIIGIAVYSYSLSKLIFLFEEISLKNNYLREKENKIIEFCRQHNLSKDLLKEIKNYLLDNQDVKYSFYSYKFTVSNFNELTECLPKAINKNLYFEVINSKLSNIPLIKGINDTSFLIYLCSLINLNYFNFNEVIYKPGDIAKEIFIVWKGKVVMKNTLKIKSYQEYLLKKTPFFAINKNRSKVIENYHSAEKQRIMTYFTKYNMFGENDIYKNDGMTRKFIVKTCKNSILISLKKCDLKLLLKKNVEFNQRVRICL